MDPRIIPELQRAPLGYLPLAGTHGWRDGWCTRDDHPFSLMMACQGFYVVRRPNGDRWRWSTVLDGLFGDDETWIAAGENLADFLAAYVPFEHRNVIAHSHGGNVAAIAAQSVPLRTLTTIGTPRREELDYQKTCDNVGYWQHIYDRQWDFWGWAGSLGGGRLHDPAEDRAFAVVPRRGINRGMVNHGLIGISHSKVLRDEQFLHYWTANGWLEAIKEEPALFV
jgi:hypothetical protein